MSATADARVAGYRPQGDRVNTPDWCARDIARHFAPTGRILEPCRGGGAFTRAIPTAEWCEVDEGKDFFSWQERVDWIVTNPPFSLMRPFWLHAASLADHVVFLVVIRNFFGADGFMQRIEEYGGIVETRLYGGGSRLKFPMGNAVGAVYCRRGYAGDMRWSRHAY